MMWRERIQAARERGFFTLADRMDAGCMGSTTGYTRCAVGEQADRLGIHDLIFHYTDPYCGIKDQDLFNWGGNFAGSIAVGDFKDAERLLDLIEDRALVLKREVAR